jgi:hypothetical protein
MLLRNFKIKAKTVEGEIMGFEVFTAVVMKSSVFWYITPGNPLRANSRYGGICRLTQLYLLPASGLFFDPKYAGEVFL